MDEGLQEKSLNPDTTSFNGAITKYDLICSFHKLTIDNFWCPWGLYKGKVKCLTPGRIWYERIQKKPIFSYKQNKVSDTNDILSNTYELYPQQNANNHRVLGQEIVPLYEGSHRILFPQVEPKIQIDINKYATDL